MKQREIPASWVVLILLMAVIAVAALVWNYFVLQRRTFELHQRHVAVVSALQRIRVLDEAVTSYAKLGAVSGVSHYESRYGQLRGELAALLNSAVEQSPDPDVARKVREAGAANQRLLEVEKRAFTRLGQGGPTGAIALLESDEYLTQKKVFSDGMTQASAWLDESYRETEQELRQSRILSVTISGSAVLLMMLACLWAIISAHHSQSQYRRSRAKQALQANMLKNLPQKIVVKDPEGRLLWCNAAFLAHVKRPEHQVIGRTDFDLFSAELAERHRSYDRNVMASHKTQEIIEEQVDPDGQRRTVKMVKVRLDGVGDQTLGVLTIFWDVTEELQGKELEQLQERLRYTLTLSGSLHHEIRNPLTGVIGNLQLCLLTDGLPKHVRENLREAEAAANRIHEVMTKLSSLNKDITIREFGESNVLDLEKSV